MEINEAGGSILDLIYTSKVDTTADIPYVIGGTSRRVKLEISKLKLEKKADGIFYAELTDPAEINEFTYFRSNDYYHGGKGDSSYYRYTTVSYEFIPGVSKIRLELYPWDTFRTNYAN